MPLSGVISRRSRLIPSNWNLLLLVAMQDTTDHFDSLYKVYAERVLVDLRRPAGTGGFSKAAMLPQQEASSNDRWLSFTSIQPNPASGSCLLTLRSSHAAMATIEIVSVSGAVVSSTSAQLAKGTNEVLLRLPSASVGLYVVRCTAGDLTVRLPLVVEP